MEGREKRASSPDASASEEPKRLKLEEKENWTTVTVVHSSGAQSPSSTLQRDATTSYATNRETVYHKNARTIEETHLIKSTGSSNEGFSEEHWTSEIKSYITTQPPKFVQVIRAFRVLATDTLTLVVEVESDPPAIFEWFCNDRPVQQDRRRFKVRHGINITTLTVEGPEQGVYKCTARNPAGISTTYGYITVNAPPQYKKWVEQKHAVVIEEKVETVSNERIGITIRQAPRFVNQVPNLTLKPGVEAVIDVEVEASPPAKFTWFVNGFELHDSSGRLEVYYPKENRCVARFPIPQSGEYKVIAENSVGRDQSIGYVDVKKEVSARQMQRPPLPAEHMRHVDAASAHRHRDFLERMDKGRASSVTKNYEVYEESSYYQRSTSLPRAMRGIEKHIEVSSNADLLRRRQEETDATTPYSSTNEIYHATQREDDYTETLCRTTSESSRFLPQAPLFTSALPEDVHLSSKEKLVLSVDVKASPPAEIAWKLDGTEVEQTETVSLLDEHNRSTLVVQPPVKQGIYTVTAKNEVGESTLSTSVHRVEEETFVQVDEQMVVSSRWITARGRSTPPEIVDNAITVTSTSDGWEVVEEADAMKSSTESFETVKLAEGGRLSIGRDEDQTPKSHAIPCVRTSTFAQRVSEEHRMGVPHPTIITVPKSSEKIETFATEVIEERRLVPAYLPRKSIERLPQRPFVVKQPPPEMFVKAGEKLVLCSKVDSHPESSFKWYHNNFELRPSTTIKIESPAPNESRATFEKPTDGIYKVTATNLYGSCSSSTRVVTEVVEQMVEESSVSVVRLPQPQPQPKFQLVRKARFESRSDLPKAPQIKKKFATLIRVPQKQPLVLSIEADAIPEATFTWRVNNFEVRPSALVHIERPAPNVSQATFTKPAEGKYEVIAANELGSATCSTKVAVDFEPEVALEKKTVVSPPHVVQKPPTFVQPLPAETRLSSNNEELHLSVIVDSQHPVTFRWFADGSLLSNSIEHQMINEAFKSELLIRRPISHPTDYAVEVSNNYGTIWSETRACPPTVIKTSATVEELLATEAVTEVQQKAPRFTTPLYPIEVEEGDRFTAKVIVDQDGSPCEFLWYLNGKDLRTLPGFRVESTHYESTLIVDSTTTRNSGRLSVVARNRYGTAESSATVSVNEKEESFEVITTGVSIPSERPPKIIVPLHSTVFTSGEPMVLRCRIDAMPPAQITWSKDEIDLAEWVISEDITTTVLPDGTYELSKPQCTTEDAGFYQCSARNAHGKAETAAYVTVEETVYAADVHETEIHKITVTKSPSPYVPQEAPKFIETMEAVVEGNETVLTCKVHSEAPVEISWYHGSMLLLQSDKHTMGSMADGTQTLTIRNVVKEDEGIYICRAESRYGVAETSSQIKTIKEEKQTSVEEVMIEEHDDEQIQIPQRTEFRKKVFTDTTMKVVAETEITSSEENYSRTAELRKSEEAYKLLVKVAETVASSLVAKVVIDEAIREAVYRIREETRTSDEEEIFYETTDIEEQPSAPRFETNIECYNVRAGDTVRLATDVRGHPTPTVEWYFGQQRIQQSSRTEVLYSNGRSTLLIKKATKADEGTYYCHAENRFGKSVLSCDLRVIDTSKSRTQSTLDFSKTTKYVSSESESEVFSNVHVNHSEETFEHHIAFLQPQTIALGYDCRASTSKVCDDSVIIRRETVAVTSERLIPTEKEVTLNVNVEKPAPQFTHDVRILQPNEAGAFLISKEKRVVRSEEVMQTTDITLTERQRRAHGTDSTVNTSATVVIEKPTQRLLHEVTCLYDDRISLPEQRFHAVTSVEITQLQAVNELFSSVLARKDEHLAYEMANVEVRRPPSQFDHTTIVVECEIAHISAHLTAPTTSAEEIIVVELSLGKYSPVLSDEITRIERSIRRASAEQRIVILEGSAQSFSEAVTWSLRRVRKAAAISGEAITNASIEVRKPSEQGEHVTTVIDSSTIMPEILAIAAAATKMKITSVFITLTKKGEVAHQALVIEYESFVEEEAALNIALLTVPAFHSKQEETWTREMKIVETHDERNVVAVFVEVDANCPDQSVELVASVSVPIVSNENLLEVQKSSYSMIEKSASVSESSSLGILQAPKFLKKLENITSTIGNTLQFKCIVSGTPMPEIRWFVDGDEIHSSSEYETVYEDGVCILRINEVVIEDEGEYTCEATNAAGRATTKCFLHTATVADYDDRQWRRSLSKKSISEETNSYILFEAPPAEETIEVHAFIAETVERTPVSSVYEDSQTTVGTTEAFDCSSLHVFVDKEFSSGGELSNMEVSAIIAETIQQIRLSLILYSPSDEQVECFFQFTASCAEEICEILCCYHCPEDHVRSYHMTSVSDEMNLSLHMTRSCLVENASIIEIVSSSERKASEKLAVYDECKALILKKCFSREHLQAVVPVRLENVSVQLSVAVPGSLELDSNSGLLRNVQDFSELNLLKEQSSDNVHMTMARTSSPGAVEACIESSGSYLWNERFDNPFPQEAIQVHPSDEEKLYEPRTPLLPQRVTYKGHEVGLSVHEVGKVICGADEKNIKPDRQVIERCVEAIFDLGSTIREYTEERTLKRQELKAVRGAEYVSKVAENKVVGRSAELVEHNAAPSDAGFISKDAEGTVMTEEDIDMFQEDEISELILEIIDETEERSRLEELSETNMAEENEFVFCSLRKLSDYGEAVENRGIQIPTQPDASGKPSVNEEVIPQALQEHMPSQRALSELKECNYVTEIRRTEEIVKRVEAELESMQVGDGSSSLCEGARRIERAIYDVSDRIVKQQPVTEAQAAANEELLRTTLEEVIMDVPVSSSEECHSVYKKPIAFLKQKLTDFENSFIVDEEVEVIVDNAENGKPEGLPTTALAVSGTSDEQNVAKSTKKVIVKRMSSEFARMTPITANIQQQLSTLETMLDESELEELEDREEMATEETKLLHKEPVAKRREMHSILVQINHELNTVKRYCQKNSKKGTDAIFGVLNKVRNHVASTVNLVSRSKKRRSRTASPDKHLSKSGFFFRTDASINFNLFKKQSDEYINVIVIYRSGSEKPVWPGPRNDIIDSVMYQCGYKLSAGSTEKAVTPESEQNVVIFTGVSRTDSAGCKQRVAKTSFGATDAPAPIPPPRHCRPNVHEGDVPMRPPRPRRSQSKDVEEKKVAEMLMHGGTQVQPLVTAGHDAVQHAEISQLQEQLKKRMAELDGQSASFTSSDSVINETEVQELQVRRRSSAENVLAVLAFAPRRRAFFTTLDETSSVQLICEESDYGNESDTGSRTVFGSAKMHPAYALHKESIPEVNEKCLLEDLSKTPTKGCEHISSITQQCWSDDPVDFRKVSVSASEGSANLSRKSENVDVEVDIIFRQRSESFREDSIGIVRITRDTDQMSSTSDVYVRPDIVETSSLNDIESLLDRDEQSEETSDIRVVCSTNATLPDMVSIMSTIMERSEISKTNSSAMTVSRSSATTATTTDSLLPRIGHIEKSEGSQTSSFLVANPYVREEDGTSEECICDCSAKNGEKAEENLEAHEDVFEEVCLNLKWKRPFQKYKVLCTLSPDVRMGLRASAAVGECFEVEVEQPSESQGYLIRITDDVSDSICLSLIEVVAATVDVEVSLSNDEQTDFEEVIAVQPERYKLLMCNTGILNSASNGNIPVLEDNTRCTGVSVSIIARSIHDIVYASLEEIPWGEVSMNVYLTEVEITRSTSRCDSENRTNSLIQNVTVSELNENERKSLRSQESFKSSQRSLAFSDRTDRYDSMQSLNIPSYVLKEGSTATITCELNNFLSPSSQIDWFKGKVKVETVAGKIDRISHDLLEVLVISHVELADSDLYSIQVDDQVYPVACIIVEEEVEKLDEATPVFLSPPQTLFVMEGQPAIISCQVSAPGQKIVWCKEKKAIDCNERFKIESDDNGFHRLIIEDSELGDQGTYCAYLGNQFTSITLVVEEQIDEKELTVTASGTESEEDDFREYVVPPGSTATIACELEKSDEIRELSWRKDGTSIVFNDDAKMEHVVNGLKHYLVIHDTQPSDSASYSVRINNAEFKVAHMTVSDYATSVAGKRAKRISNSSLQHF